MATRKNSQIQKSFAKSLNASVATINKIMNQDLQLKKAKRHYVYQLLPRLMSQRRIFFRTLYENYLVGDKWKYIVNFDKPRVTDGCNKKRFIYTLSLKKYMHAEKIETQS